MSDTRKLAAAINMQRRSTFPTTLRQGAVAAVAADGTCTVTVAGDSTEVANVVTVGPVVAGQSVWLLVRGGDLLALGSPWTQPSVDLPAAAFGTQTGSPAEGMIGRAFTWVLPNGSSSGISTTFRVPDSWSSVDVTAVHSKPSGSGDVRVGVRITTAEDGGDLTVDDETDTVTVTAGPTDVASHDVIGSGLSVTGGQSVVLRVVRLGADGADTLSAGWNVLGVLVEAS